MGKASEHASKPSRNTYIIDTEKYGAETSRLLLQDKLFTQAMGGTLPATYDLTGVTRILDIACGPGGWALEVAYQHSDIEVVGIDISPAMIEYARSQAQVQHLENAAFLVMDTRTPLAFPDASFDLINARLLLSFVNHLRLEAGGLHLDSTATLHTEAGVQLWLRCPRHQGQLTGAPSCSNPVEARAFSW